jgi:hypothetical protein
MMVVGSQLPRAPRRLHVRWAVRALFIWLCRRFPRILDAIIIVRPERLCVGTDWDLPHTGDGNRVGSAAGPGLARRCET